MPSDRKAQAWQRLQEAYQAQMEGDYDRAVELYRGSLALHPTAEAHTYFGWTSVNPHARVSFRPCLIFGGGGMGVVYEAENISYTAMSLGGNV